MSTGRTKVVKDAICKGGRQKARILVLHNNPTLTLSFRHDRRIRLPTLVCRTRWHLWPGSEDILAVLQRISEFRKMPVYDISLRPVRTRIEYTSAYLPRTSFIVVC